MVFVTSSSSVSLLNVQQINVSCEDAAFEVYLYYVTQEDADEDFAYEKWREYLQFCSE